MSVYQLSVIGGALGQEIRNVFHYRTTNPGVLEGNATDLATIFDANRMPQIVARLNTIYNANAIDVFDLFFPTNIFTLSINRPGTFVGENIGTRVAATLRTNRATRAIRRGQKRFGPIGEGQQAGGQLIVAEVTAFDTLGATLANSLVGLTTYTPIVVKRIFVALPQPHYRLPANLAEYQAFDISSWTVNERITTQNTRRLPFL